MRSVNKVILIGNLTRDPEHKTTTSGQSVTTFGLATNRDWVTQSGEKKSLPEYHNIAVWGQLAKICAQHLKKGKLVYVEGYLKTRSWDSPEGAKIFRTEIVGTDVIMLNKRLEEKDMGEGDPMGDVSPFNGDDMFNPDMGEGDPGMP